MAEPTPGLLHRIGRAWHSLAHSLRLRLVAMFLLLALAMSVVFFGGMQKALSIGWRDAARPLMADYVARLAVEVGDPPSVERAEALVRRLPLSVRIHGPQINWQSQADWHRPGPGPGPRLGPGHRPPPWGRPDWAERDRMEERSPPLLEHITRDGHRIEFGLSVAAWEHQRGLVVWVMLGTLLVLTGLAYAYVRHLLRPLDDIGSGARRFGRGEFGQPIGLKRKDELGDLAREVDKMAQDIHGMLEAKRALLLAISHELRSPLTRARLNTELLPDGADQPDVAARREALLRDLALMRDLVTDLLESERLASPHAALHLVPTDLAKLVHEVLAEWPDAEPGAPRVSLDVAPDLPSMPLDASRLRLLLRNLLDNALRHSAGVGQAPQLRAARLVGDADLSKLEIIVRDFGPGVEESALAHLAEPFYRPDSARQRATGGVGLGLYLCKLVAQAHGGTLSLRNAQPGLEARVLLPLR